MIEELGHTGVAEAGNICDALNLGHREQRLNHSLTISRHPALHPSGKLRATFEPSPHRAR
jgi:hypothetical protein